MKGSGGAVDEREPAADLVGRARHVVAVGAPDAGRLGARPQHHPGEDDRADRVQVERQLGDDAEVAAAAAQAPQQLAVAIHPGAHDLAVRGDDLGSDQALAADPVHALDPAAAAAQGQPGHAGVRHAAAGDGEAVLLGGGVELAPRQAAPDPRGACLGIDVDGLHRPDVDHEPVVAARVAGRRVAAAADGHGKVVLAREEDRGHDVVGGRAAGDERRTLVDHPVEDGAGVVVATVGRDDQLAGEAAAQGVEDVGLERRAGGHSESFRGGVRICPAGQAAAARLSTLAGNGKPVVKHALSPRPRCAPPRPRSATACRRRRPARASSAR